MEEDRDYYRLLDNIGTTEKKKRKIITKQIIPVFLCPLMLAMLHATFGIKSASTVFGLVGSEMCIRDRLKSLETIPHDVWYLYIHLFDIRLYYNS